MTREKEQQEQESDFLPSLFHRLFTEKQANEQRVTTNVEARN